MGHPLSLTPVELSSFGFWRLLDMRLLNGAILDEIRFRTPRWHVRSRPGGFGCFFFGVWWGGVVSLV